MFPRTIAKHLLAVKTLISLVLLFTVSCVGSYSYSSLENLYREADAIASGEGFIAPIAAGEYVAFKEAGFGFKRDPFYNQLYFQSTQWLFCKVGTPVLSVCNGQIVSIGRNKALLLELVVKNGDFTLSYASLRIAEGLKPGDTVTQGMYLGCVVSNFDSIGPRLRLQLSYKNVLLDPAVIIHLIDSNSSSNSTTEDSANHEVDIVE